MLCPPHAWLTTLDDSDVAAPLQLTSWPLPVLLAPSYLEFWTGGPETPLQNGRTAAAGGARPVPSDRPLTDPRFERSPVIS